MLNKGTIQHVCLGEECVPKPDCVHGEWNFGAKECKCTGADNGVQGFCKDDNGACTLAKKYDAMNREFYCDDEGEDVVVPLDCKHGNWDRSESKCVCFGAEGANGFCLDSEGICTVTRLFDFSVWKYFCPENGQRRLRLRGEAI